MVRTTLLLLLGTLASAQQGIPVTDDLLVAKCGGCHARDASGLMDRISFERTTPEEWQNVLKRMIVVNDIAISPAEARSIVKYLSTRHGLAPEEAKTVLYDAERRVYDETAVRDRTVKKDCSNCHNLARPLAWRRTPEDWKQFGAEHVRRFGLKASAADFEYFANAAPLLTPEWTEWSGKPRPTNVAGRWLITADLPGRGTYVGEVQVQLVGEDEFSTVARLTSVSDGSTITRTGRGAGYGGYAWRGRSQGDPGSEAREVMWFSPDQATAQGRWFWGQYQEFGFDVQLRRPTPRPTLLSVQPAAIKPGMARIRLLGDAFPTTPGLSDFDIGPGVTIGKIVSASPREIVLDVSVTTEAPIGKRDVRFLGSSGSLTIYDRVDYIAVSPDTALAAFADTTHPAGYRQFAANAYQRGPDNKIHTQDDLDLGPIAATWSLEVFYDTDGTRSKLVGSIDGSGLFTPAAKNPEQNFDVWAIATATGEDGKPLVGKSYLVVTVPTYSFAGRRYVRDLGRWVDDGPATQ